MELSAALRASVLGARGRARGTRRIGCPVRVAAGVIGWNPAPGIHHVVPAEAGPAELVDAGQQALRILEARTNAEACAQGSGREAEALQERVGAEAAVTEPHAVLGR